MGKKRKKTVRIASKIFGGYDKLTALWCLRALLPLGAHIEVFDGYRVSEEILRAVGIKAPDDFNDESARKKVLRQMKQLLVRLEEEKPQANSCLKANVEWLSKTMGLSATEQEILTFVIVLSSDKDLEKCMEALGGGNQYRLITILSELLHLPREEIQDALRMNGMLLSSGLLTVEDGSNSVIFHTFNLKLLDGLAQAMQTHHTNGPKDVFLNYFYPSQKGMLRPENFEYASDHYSLIRNYLSSTRRKKTKGVNILIHGKPGTGKTQMVRTVTQELGIPLYEVSMGDNSGNPYTSKQRFASYRLAQKILPKSDDSAILFDEIEDVFPCETAIYSNDQLRLKGWTNRLLEENETPTFWLSNHIHQIDHAYLRRFDLIIELETPPMQVRHEILKSYFQGTSHRPEWLEELSRTENLTPSQIETTAKVLRHLPSEDIEDNERLLEVSLETKLKAFGIKKAISRKVETGYRLDLINSDYPLEKVVSGFRQQPSGRVCLYGPSGTGKSAFAHYLSDEIGMPVLVRKPSDLMGPYVGMTEALIAEMFSKATVNKAILLLDEADSFLRSRESARASWEVTLVNELLVQMEEFEGIFICTTNLVDSLDHASMRRFDLKVKFDSLHPKQSWELFRQEFLQNDDKPPTQAIRQRILNMDNLTPGDIAMIKRQSRFLGNSLEEAVNSLEKESWMKTERNGGKPIGFIN